MFPSYTQNSVYEHYSDTDTFLLPKPHLIRVKPSYVFDKKKQILIRPLCMTATRDGDDSEHLRNPVPKALTAIKMAAPFSADFILCHVGTRLPGHLEF